MLSTTISSSRTVSESSAIPSTSVRAVSPRAFVNCYCVSKFAFSSDALPSARTSAQDSILRTNIAQWNDEVLWQTYVQLTAAEAAFRVRKSALAMRPIWHHKADRIKAPILICLIA